jgi:hypothetical protein
LTTTGRIYGGATIARHVPFRHPGLERIVTLCLSGPEAERVFCGPIVDGGDRTDQQMALGYLSERLASCQIEAELTRCQNAAAHLVRSRWGRRTITKIAAELVQRGTLVARG